ncbi:hypothetical protein [Pokkaliibacter plantistimulans]|nr:hypothetical protein [Pokkaliibacter plantistimulans]
MTVATYILFLSNNECSFIKIGRTTRLLLRIKDISLFTKSAINYKKSIYIEKDIESQLLKITKTYKTNEKYGSEYRSIESLRPIKQYIKDNNIETTLIESLIQKELSERKNRIRSINAERIRELNTPQRKWIYKKWLEEKERNVYEQLQNLPHSKRHVWLHIDYFDRAKALPLNFSKKNQEIIHRIEKLRKITLKLFKKTTEESIHKYLNYCKVNSQTLLTPSGQVVYGWVATNQDSIDSSNLSITRIIEIISNKYAKKYSWQEIAEYIKSTNIGNNIPLKRNISPTLMRRLVFFYRESEAAHEALYCLRKYGNCNWYYERTILTNTKK